MSKPFGWRHAGFGERGGAAGRRAARGPHAARTPSRKGEGDGAGGWNRTAAWRFCRGPAGAGRSETLSLRLGLLSRAGGEGLQEAAGPPGGLSGPGPKPRLPHPPGSTFLLVPVPPALGQGVPPTVTVSKGRKTRKNAGVSLSVGRGQAPAAPPPLGASTWARCPEEALVTPSWPRASRGHRAPPTSLHCHQLTVTASRPDSRAGWCIFPLKALSGQPTPHPRPMLNFRRPHF